MTLEPGTRLGPYEIVQLRGKGGMGEVYRARDRRLGREVAVKVLPAELSEDESYRRRLDREAKTISQLQHPNVCALYDVGSEGGVGYLVMEYLEGETLENRLARGAVRAPEVLQIGREIAEALEAAHRRGIVHRDLKPGNVMLTSAGVKVLDFGLARGVAPPDSAGDSTAATMPETITEDGRIVGTMPYMAPEQLQGTRIDARTDIWALGCVLYELATGERAFRGESRADLMVAILSSGPEPPSHRRLLTPPRLGRVVSRCLEKDPERRWQSARDVGLELEVLAAEPETGKVAGGEASAVPPAIGRWGLTLVLAVAIVAAALAGLGGWYLKPDAPRPVARSVLSAPPSEPLLVSPAADDLYEHVAIAPDGRTVVYRAADSLYVRRIEELQGAALRGTEGGENPFFSPDGEWVGFVQENTLKKVPLSGGRPQTIFARPSEYIRFPRWEEDGTILFGFHMGAGLYRVRSAGGEGELVVELDRHRELGALGWPRLLPGGRAMLFTRIRFGAPSEVWVLDLETGERRALLPEARHAVYLPTGHLLYALEGALLAVRFDPVDLEVLSDPAEVLDGLAWGESESFAVSRQGSLVYVSGTARTEARSSLVWVDREGREEPLGTPPNSYTYPAISPDGTRVAVTITSFTGSNSTDVWIWDIGRRTLSRLTADDESLDLYSVWTPDSRELIVSSGPVGDVHLYRRAADGTGAAQRLTAQSRTLFPRSLSPDGATLVYRSGARTAFDLGVLDLAGGEPRPLLAEDFGEKDGTISPDGRFLAYQADESGRFEIYVRPFPDVDTSRWRISDKGGSMPLWSPDGQELFYRENDRVMAVAIRAEPTFDWETPRPLFSWTPARPGGSRMYDIHPDGDRFLMVKPEAAAAGTRNDVVLVQSFSEELKRLLPND